MLESYSNILDDLYKNCKDAKEKIQYEALYAVSRGNDVKTVADIIAVEESTVYDWIHQWEAEHVVSDKPRSGRPTKLTEKDEKEIKELIDDFVKRLSQETIRRIAMPLPIEALLSVQK